MDRGCVLLRHKMDGIACNLSTITPEVTETCKLVKALREECSVLNGQMADCWREVRKLHSAVNHNGSTARTTVAATGINAAEVLDQVKKMAKDLSVHQKVFNDLHARLPNFPTEN